MHKIRFLFILIISFLLIIPATCLANASPKKVPLSPQLNDSLAYLLAYADRGRQPPNIFEPQRIENVVDFVLSPKSETVRYLPGKIRKTPSAYIEMDISVSLEHLMGLAYNPNIPAVLTAPSSVRMTEWRQVNGRRQTLPDLKENLGNLQSPIILSGIEYIENTPDTFSGAYYDYELNRTVILYRHLGRNILISITAQKNTSNVGKKGIILGDDQNWDYLYTDRPGNTMTGIGWAKTYMYDSYSVTVYCETDAERPMVRVGFFKWVRAGWADVNLVRTDHIYSGLKRFIRTYKNILESPNLADVTPVERNCIRIERLSTEQLRQTTRDLFSNLAVYYAQTPGISDQRIESILNNPKYISRMSRLEMKSLLIIEYVKRLLGKNYHTQVALPDTGTINLKRVAIP